MSARTASGVSAVIGSVHRDGKKVCDLYAPDPIQAPEDFAGLRAAALTTVLVEDRLDPADPGRYRVRAEGGMFVHRWRAAWGHTGDGEKWWAGLRDGDQVLDGETLEPVFEATP